MTHASTIDRIKAFNDEFIGLTGREAFGYVSNPTPTSQRITFGDGTVHTSTAAAYDYMAWLVDTARRDPKKLPYPFDQELTPAQDLRLIKPTD